jgi:phosphoserine aminotransferase
MTTYFTPGPSQLYPTVAGHLQQALADGIGSISHRSKAAEASVQATTEALRALLGLPAEHSIFFLPSATECWERILQNCVQRESFHLVNGSFSEKFHKTALLLGKTSSAHGVPYGEGFDLGKLQVPDSAELIALIANETSTGVQMPPEDIAAIRRQHPDKLIAVDVVTAAPHAEIDYADTDLAYVSVQKGFGMPAGLAVLVVSPRALEKARKLETAGQYTGAHHSFAQLHKNALLHQTPCTPNVLFIHLLGKVAQDMLQKGIGTIRRETREKAALLEAAVSRNSSLELFVQETRVRSETIVVATVTGGSEPLIQHLKEKGFWVGNGYQQFKGKQIRIANFPATQNGDVMGLCEALANWQ